MSRSNLDFVRQQGFTDPESMARRDLHAALMFQPRVIGVVAFAGTLLQNPEVFLLLSLALWWSAFVPAYSPFDALYSHLIAHPRRLRAIPAAPAPRRFAQVLAAAFALVIAAALLMRAMKLAWVFEGLLGGALAAIMFGNFCLGSYVYHRLRSCPSTKPSPDLL